MSVVYRSVVEIETHAVPDGVLDVWCAWLASKYHSLGLEGVTVADGLRVQATCVRATREAATATRASLREDGDEDHWTTTMTAMRDGDVGAWLWVDLEYVSADVFSRRPTVAAPRLMPDLLATFACTSGGERMTAAPTVVDRAGLPAFETWLMSSARVYPVVAVTEAPNEQREDALKRATRFARAVAGLAFVSLLTPAAALDLEQHLGWSMSVADGAVRTYLPQVSRTDPQPWRHRLLSYRRWAARSDYGAGVIVASLGHLMGALRPPKFYRDVVRTLPGFPADPDRDPTALLQEIIDLEEALDDANLEIRRLTEDLEFRGAELEEVERTTTKLRAQVAYLKSRVDREDAVTAETVEVREDPDTCVEALNRGREELPNLTIPASVDEAGLELDKDANQGLYATKAWKALEALNAYVGHRNADGQPSASFLQYCHEANAGEAAISANTVALQESETTTNNERYRGARVLPVDRAVDASGSVYMPAHVKLGMGGKFPRIHFYDDSKGVTGRVHVGYLGVHLASIRKN
jgi:hypothetical protein